MEVLANSWVVLWSPRQKLFHLETWDQMMNSNYKIFKRDSGGDFILMGVFESRDEAELLLKDLKKIRDERSKKT